MSAEAILEESAALITNARQTGTSIHYKSPLGKWSGWDFQGLINSFQASLAEISNFLTYCFHESYKYNTIAGYKSAISAYHEPIIGLQ